MIYKKNLSILNIKFDLIDFNLFFINFISNYFYIPINIMSRKGGNTSRNKRRNKYNNKTGNKYTNKGSRIKEQQASNSKNKK